MMNSTQDSWFILSAFFDTKMLKYLWFLILMFLYLLILFCNLLLIVVICVDRNLHQPMYMFLCSLLVNDLYGSSALFPFLLPQLLSDVHTVSLPLCFLQIFCLSTYGSTEFMNLAVMSYDRYLSICFPLQYGSEMTASKVKALIAASWFSSFLIIVSTTSLSFTLILCGNVINKVYCTNYSIVKLSCSDTTLNNVYGLLIAACGLLWGAILIIFTYMRILRVCYCGSKQTRQKALSTCTPHLASLINYLMGWFFEIIQSRFDMSALPNLLRIVLSLYFLTVTPLFNPLIYGLKLSKIRSSCKKLFSFNE